MNALIDHLFAPPPQADVFHPLAVVVFVLFLIGLIVSVVLPGRAAERWVSHPIPRKELQRIAGVSAYICGAGVFFFLIRFLQINPFSFGCPIWIWLCVIALAVYLAREWLRWKRTMSEAIAKYDREQVKQQYLRAAQDSAAERKRRSS